MRPVEQRSTIPYTLFVRAGTVHFGHLDLLVNNAAFQVRISVIVTAHFAKA